MRKANRVEVFEGLRRVLIHLAKFFIIGCRVGDLAMNAEASLNIFGVGESGYFCMTGLHLEYFLSASFAVLDAPVESLQKLHRV